jgi:hypothetical protein
MGLDMYLNARRYIWQSFSDTETPDSKIIKGIQALFPGLGDLQVKGVTVEAMYWRKANAIHKWFVDNCQNGVDECQETYVTRDQLIELRDLCLQVIAEPDRASELLPSQSGFFFGSTEYDEHYMRDCHNTVERINQLINNPEFEKNWDFYYRSSW